MYNSKLVKQYFCTFQFAKVKKVASFIIVYQNILVDYLAYLLAISIIDFRAFIAYLKAINVPLLYFVFLSI